MYNITWIHVLCTCTMFNIMWIHLLYIKYTHTLHTLYIHVMHIHIPILYMYAIYISVSVPRFAMIYVNPYLSISMWTYVWTYMTYTCTYMIFLTIYVHGRIPFSKSISSESHNDSRQQSRKLQYIINMESHCICTHTCKPWTLHVHTHVHIHILYMYAIYIYISVSVPRCQVSLVGPHC